MLTNRQPPSARQFGYGISALVNLILAWGVNVWPGWDAVPFLTEDTTQVVPVVNLALLIGFGVNVAYIFFDPPWFKALGSVLTVGVSVAVLVRTLQVFPFDFGDSASIWDSLTEGILIFLVVTSALGLVVQLVQLVRLLVRGPGAAED
jgi:hypothetical protein